MNEPIRCALLRQPGGTTEQCRPAFPFIDPEPKKVDQVTRGFRFCVRGFTADGIAAFTPVVGTRTQIEGYSVAMAAVTILSIPSLLLFCFLQRYFIQGLSQGSVKQ